MVLPVESSGGPGVTPPLRAATRRAYDAPVNARPAPLLLSLCLLAACGAKTAPDAAGDAAAQPVGPIVDAGGAGGAVGTADARPSDAARPGDAGGSVASPDAALDAALAPTEDAGPNATDATPDVVVAPLADAGGQPAPDAFSPPPGPPGRVCCVDAAECAEGQACVRGRCGGDPGTPACDPACDRDLTDAAWVHLAADPLMDARPEVVSGTLVSDARMPGGVGRRFELALEDGTMRGFVYVIPAPLTLPFALGETVRFEATGLQQPGIDGHATLSGPEGVRLAVINRRGAEPATRLGLSMHLEDLGCGPTLVGNCLLAMPATLIFDAAGGPPTIAHTGDALVYGGWNVHVARVYRDANACEAGLHDLYANLLLTRGQP